MSKIELAAGTHVEGYCVVRPLGSGQMGDVFEATDSDGASVALKFLKFGPTRDRDMLVRFQREAKLCGALSNRHIVPVTGYGVFRNTPFLVMRKLTGHDLESWLERTGPLDPSVAVSLMLGAAEGLACAHEAGAVHRDLKPANIFLDEGPDAIVTPILCDFGIAKIFDEEGALTATGAVLGTPLYMAPEQLFDSKHVDARTDVWALSMTLYHALAGRTAFHECKTVAEIGVALNEGRVPPLQDFAPWIEPGLARVVHAGLLAYDKRFPSVRELASALRLHGPAERAVRVGDLVPLADGVRARVTTTATLPKHRADVGSPSADPTVKQGPQPPRTADSTPSTLGGRYRLGGKLGSGGMGAVFEAQDSATGASVAVKVMHAEAGAGEENVRRFVREARAAGSIDSPNAVKLIESGVDADSGLPYIVMERLTGRDLSHVARELGALDSRAAVELVLHACNALAVAHARGIVHRDIKPSNLFAHESADGSLQVKVCDFGIAKQISLAEGAEASTELTRTGGLLGSPIYMSPEQAKSSKNVDGRTDVWSLCISLHELLSGQKPWAGRTTMGEIIVAICTEPVPALAEIAPWVDPALAAVVEKGLERDPTRRYATAKELADALRPFGLGRAVTQSDLVSSNRTPHPRRSSSSVGVATGTDNLVSVVPTSRGSSSRVAGLALTAIVLLGAGIGAGVWRVNASRPASASSSGPSTLALEAPSAIAVSSASASSSAPSVLASSSASSAVAIVSSAAPSVVKHADKRGAASASARASASAASAGGTTSATSSVGRGVTATDLPPGGP